MNAIEFIDSLKRDKARGVIAPHQIILLYAFYNLFNKCGKHTFDIDELNTEFQIIWSRNKDKFHSTNNILGMPLRAFFNQGYINLAFSGEILDFRKLNDLKKNIKSVQIGSELLKIFKFENIEYTLIDRLDK